MSKETDYEKFLSIMNSANIKFVKTSGRKDYDSDDNKYVANYAGYDNRIIIVHEFKNNGKLNDIYVADACNTLEDFLNA